MPTTKPFPFKVGADPELSMLLNGQKAHAERVLSHFVDKKYFDAGAGGFKTPEMKGRFGWDGCSATAEIRPDAAKTAEELCDNIGSLFKAILPKLPCFDFSTLSIYAPIGGHLHLDLPPNLDSAKIQILMNQLASFYLPIMLSENSVSQAVRCRNYGKLSDYHAEVHEGVRTLEFRAPSAEWITTPKVAKAFIAYMATVWNEILKHPANVAKYKSLLLKGPKQMEALQTLVNSNFTALTLKMFADTRKAVKTFEFYPQYKKEIDFMCDPKAVLKEKREAGYDPAIGWKLKAKVKVNQDLFLSKKALEKANKENALSLDFMAKNMAVPFNRDINVEPFAIALSERMASLGWKPKNNYYFFGLKKGTDAPLVADKDFKVAFGAEKVPTIENQDHMRIAIDKMYRRANELYSQGAVMIDPDSGKIARSTKPIIVFGLPAEMREKKQTKTVLKLIWQIEKGKVPFNPIQVVAPVAGKDLPVAEPVTLAETESMANMMDMNSQAMQYAQNAICDMSEEDGDNDD